MSLQKAIKERGLPDDSEWEDINAYDSNKSLKKYIKEMGLPDGSTWDDVTRSYQIVIDQYHRENPEDSEDST